MRGDPRAASPTSSESARRPPRSRLEAAELSRTYGVGRSLASPDSDTRRSSPVCTDTNGKPNGRPWNSHRTEYKTTEVCDALSAKSNWSQFDLNATVSTCRMTLVELPQQGQHVQLVRDVEERCRLVEEQDRYLLGP